jgi:3-methyladenine DNA glycosylase Tag
MKTEKHIARIEAKQMSKEAKKNGFIFFGFASYA